MKAVLLVASCVLASLVVVSHAASLKPRKMIAASLLKPRIVSLKLRAECSGAGDPFPNPDDCATFLQCEASGVAAVKECPADLVFNPELKVCDYRWNVVCDDSSSSSSSSSSSESDDDDDDDSSSDSSSSSEEGDDDDNDEDEDEDEDEDKRNAKVNPKAKRPLAIPIRA